MASTNLQDLQTIDKRIADRLIARGRFTRDEHDAALRALDDSEQKAENIAARIYGETHGTDGE